MEPEEIEVMDIADDDDDMPIPSTSSSATASTSAGHNNGGHKQSTIYSEILSEYREKYQIRFSEKDGESLFPKNFVLDAVAKPIMDFYAVCKKIQNEYDKKWESKEHKEKIVETVRKNLTARAQADGIPKEILLKELEDLNTSTIRDIPRILDIDKIPCFQQFVNRDSNITSTITIPDSAIPPAVSPPPVVSSPPPPVVSSPPPPVVSPPSASPPSPAVSPPISSVTLTEPSTKEPSTSTSTTPINPIISPLKRKSVMSSPSKPQEKMIKSEMLSPSKNPQTSTTTKRPPLICGLCAPYSNSDSEITFFASKIELLTHLRNIHPWVEHHLVLDPYPRCIDCLAIFPDTATLTRHVGAVPSECPKVPISSAKTELSCKLRRCPICSKTFQSTEKASLCLAKEHDKIRCYLCLAIFPLNAKDEHGKKINLLKRHAKDFHSKRDSDGKEVIGYPCRFCDSIVSTMRGLVEHLVESHYDPELRKDFNIQQQRAKRQAHKQQMIKQALEQGKQKQNKISPVVEDVTMMEEIEVEVPPPQIEILPPPQIDILPPPQIVILPPTPTPPQTVQAKDPPNNNNTKASNIKSARKSSLSKGPLRRGRSGSLAVDDDTNTINDGLRRVSLEASGRILKGNKNLRIKAIPSKSRPNSTPPQLVPMIRPLQHPHSPSKIIQTQEITSGPFEPVPVVRTYRALRPSQGPGQLRGGESIQQFRPRIIATTTVTPTTTPPTVKVIRPSTSTTTPTNSSNTNQTNSPAIDGVHFRLPNGVTPGTPTRVQIHTSLRDQLVGGNINLNRGQYILVRSSGGVLKVIRSSTPSTPRSPNQSQTQIRMPVPAHQFREVQVSNLNPKPTTMSETPATNEEILGL